MSKSPLKAEKVENAPCEKHGPYPIRSLIDGVWYGHAAGCPACLRESEAAEMFRKSNIPQRYAAESLDTYKAANAGQQKVLAAARDYAENFGAYRKQGRGLILCGTEGTGKNHLATGICKLLHEQRFTTVLVKASELLDTIWGKGFAERDAWIRKLARVDLLVIDELGRQSTTEQAMHALFRVIDARSEEVLPTMVTTNLDRDGLVALLTKPGYDRLTQGGAKRYTMEWPSYRPNAHEVQP